MTEKNRKLSKDILDIYLKDCYDKHNIKISEKYIGYIINAMEDFAKTRLAKYDIIISGILIMIGIITAILMKG
jgi:hypothetical protein